MKNIELLKKLEKHKALDNYNIKIQAIDNLKNERLLSKSIVGFYREIGLLEVGSKSDYLIVDIFEPVFYHECDYFDSDTDHVFFDWEEKHLLKNTLILGIDVHGIFIGYDITDKTKSIVLSVDDATNQDCDKSSLVSYVQSILAADEKYKNFIV